MRLFPFFSITALLLRVLVFQIRMRHCHAIIESGFDRLAGLRLAIFGNQVAGRCGIEQRRLDFGSRDPVTPHHGAEAERLLVELLIAAAGLRGGEFFRAAVQRCTRIGSFAKSCQARIRRRGRVGRFGCAVCLGVFDLLSSRSPS